jgi:two-component system, response regulator YesN
MKVMLVDDHYPMLEFMYQCVPWKDKGLEVTGLCETGDEALKQARKTMPDILITDIDMPKMDGLQLIKHLREINPNLQSLIISCHDDFQYAQQAVRLFVYDYILKETLEPETLMAAVDRLVQKIQQEREQQKDVHQWKQMIDQNRFSLKRQWLRSTMQNPIMNDREWENSARSFGIDLQTTHYLPVIGYIMDVRTHTERFKSSDLLMYAVDNVTQEVIGNHSMEETNIYEKNSDTENIKGEKRIKGETALYAKNSDRENGDGVNSVGVNSEVGNSEVENYQAERSKAVRSNVEGFVYDQFEMMWFFPLTRFQSNGYDQVRSRLARLQRALRKYFQVDMAFMYTQPVGDVHELKTAITELTGVRDEWFYIDQAHVFSLASLQIDFSTEDIFLYYNHALDEMKKVIIQEDEGQIGPYVEKWIDHIRHKKYHPDAVKSWVHKIVVDIELKYNSLQHYINYSTERMHSEIHALQKLEQIQTYLSAFLLKKLHMAQDIQRQSQRQEIWEAKKYVELHIGRRISMDEVANHLHLNPSHFSRMFKKETGETFIEYVTRIKMEKACTYLSNTNQTIEDISYQLGYENTSYFSKLFKNYSGMSPVKFRLMK